MKKFIYLLAMVCSMSFLASCGDDDDNEGSGAKRLQAIEGTWKVWQEGDEWTGYKGSAIITWEIDDDAAINIPLGDTPQPLKINETVTPLVNTMANKFLPNVLQSVTFTPDGKINAVYSDDEDGDDVKWEEANGYASYTVVNDNLLAVTLNADKVTEDIDDAALKAQVKTILKQFGPIPVNIRWNGANPYFFVDKAFVQPMIATMVGILSKVPTGDMDEEDLKSFLMLKGVLDQLPDLMDKTTKFEVGLELTK